MSVRVYLGLGLFAGALVLAGVWGRAANVRPGPVTWRAVRVWHSLIQDRDVDLFDQPVAAAPRGLPDEAAATLLAVPCALAAAGDGLADPRRLGGALSLASLFALALGLGLVARALVRAGHGAACALGATAVSALALPLTARLLDAPDPALALVFLGSALVFSWRDDAGVGLGSRLAMVAMLVALEPAGVLWVPVVLWDARARPGEPQRAPVLVLLAGALVAVPVWALGYVRADAPVVACDALGVVVPAVAAAAAALGARAGRHGARAAAALAATLLVATAVAAAVAARAGVAASASGALAWLVQERGRAVQLALLPSDSFEGWATLAAELKAAWWAPGALAAGVALAAVTVRRVRPGFVLTGCAASGALTLAALYVTALTPQEVHVVTYSGAPAVVETAAAAQRWWAPEGTWATRVDLTIARRGWGSVAVTDQLARVVVRDTGGREREFLLSADVIHADERRLSLPLPWRTEVVEVRLERRHPVVQLYVSGLWLGDTHERIPALTLTR